MSQFRIQTAGPSLTRCLAHFTGLISLIADALKYPETFNPRCLFDLSLGFGGRSTSGQLGPETHQIFYGGFSKIGRLGLLICLLALPRSGISDTAEPARTNTDRYLLRLEWSNDILTGNDNGFTAAWGFSWHSRAMDSWADASRLSKWIGRTIPGLAATAEDDRKVKVGIGFNQVMQTPDDLENSGIIVDDVPYAGVLGIYTSWYSVSNEKLNAFQIYIGILGPASYAEQIQKFIHNDLDMGTDPQGWDNQLYNEPLLNVNYDASIKIWSAGTQAERSFSTDLALGYGLGLGNYFTGLSLQAEWRLGWGLPLGFTPIIEGGGRGVGMNPVIDVPHDKWSLYFSFVPSFSAVGYTVLYDTNTFRDHPHPGVDYNNFPIALHYGIHLSKQRFYLDWNAVYHPVEIADVATETKTSFGVLGIGFLF